MPKFKALNSAVKEALKICEELGIALPLVGIPGAAVRADIESLRQAIIRDGRLYQDFPESAEAHLALESSDQFFVRVLTSNKDLFINNYRNIGPLIEVTKATPALLNINRLLTKLSTALDKFSDAANGIMIDLRVGRVTREYLNIRWVRSIGTNNWCGYASFILPLHGIIFCNPALFYEGGIVPEATRKFIELYKSYLREMGSSIETFAELTRTPATQTTENIRNLQTTCSLALKKTFVHTMLDELDVTTFDNVFEIAVGGYLSPDEQDLINLNDYADYIEDFIQENRAQLDAAHAAYKIVVNAEVDADETVVGLNTVGLDAKQSLKENRYGDSIRFTQYLQSAQPELVKAAKTYYCAQLLRDGDSYMNKETDMIYIATKLGFKRIIIDNHYGFSNISTNVPNSKVDITVNHKGIHWIAAALPELDNPAPYDPAAAERVARIVAAARLLKGFKF